MRRLNRNAFVAVFAVRWLVRVAGVTRSLVLFLLMRSHVELVRIIADILLPKQEADR